VAARRLIAILLVLLFLSSLAAALAPVEQRTRTESSSSSATEPEAPILPGEGAAEARVIDQSVAISAKDPITVRARTGDRLELKFTSKRRPGTLELQGLGAAEDVGPQQPAFFDVLVSEEATSYPVTFLGSDRAVARIKVSPPRPAPR
jgi:hypothetical protein